MASVDGGFADLEKFVGNMLRSLDAGEQKKLNAHIAKTMRLSNQRRIGSQKNPDGTAYEKRKPAKDDEKSGTAMRFLYPSGGSGPPRIVFMKSWKTMGDDKFIGFDRQAGKPGMRTFLRSRIIKFLPATEATTKKPRRTIRQKAMFRKIRLSRFLRAGQSSGEAWIGFVGIIGQIASIHQFGGRDKPNPFSNEVDYPQRELLGLNEQDREDLLDAVMDHLLS